MAVRSIQILQILFLQIKHHNYIFNVNFSVKVSWNQIQVQKFYKL